MNRGEAWASGGRRGSRGRFSVSGEMGYRPNSENPVTVDRSLDYSSGSRGRGARGRGRSTTSLSLRDSSGHGGDEHSPVQVYVKKSNVVFVEKGGQQHSNLQEERVGSIKQPDEGAALKLSGDSKHLLNLSASSSSKDISFSECSFVSKECEDKDDARMCYDLVNRLEDVLLSCQDSVSSTSVQKVELSSVEDQNSSQNSGGAGSFSSESSLRPLDLVNRLEDVSLSCQDSVSSTSVQKVELSSVEDQNSSQKSGGAGNSSNESSSRPFDLFLKKKGIVLKPSQFELNREKRKATKGYTGIVIRPGMVLLKNYLSINDQVMIVNKCRQLGLGEGGFYQPGYGDEAILHLKMMCLGKNWDPESSRYGEVRPGDGSSPPKIPVEFNQFVEKAIKESQSLAASKSKETRGEVIIPFMSPDICIVNFYTSTGRLGLHQDKDESEKSIQKGLPVVSFSVGDSAEFLYSDQRDEGKAEMVVLESGDVLIFGGKSRNVFHGVRSIRKDTAPNVLVQETSLRPGRLNLTFRQY